MIEFKLQKKVRLLKEVFRAALQHKDKNRFKEEFVSLLHLSFEPFVRPFELLVGEKEVSEKELSQSLSEVSAGLELL